jgi:hypothetical protein
MKITRKQLRKLIESFIVDDKGNIVSADDAYDTALDTAAGAIDRVRAEEDRSPIGQEFVRSSSPATVTQGLELAATVGAEDDYSDFESTSLKIPEDDRMPNITMRREEGTEKAKYGEGKALADYTLVVQDRTGKEVKIPIADDFAANFDGLMPKNAFKNLLKAHRRIKKIEMIKDSTGSVNPYEEHSAYKRMKFMKEFILKLIDQYMVQLGSEGKMLRLEPNHVEINSIIDDINQMK